PVTNDETPLNNSSLLNQLVTGSFDPNDKVESNMGIFSPQQLANKEDLLYTIRFQNTGNDTAFNVVVRDTLDSRIDFTT
ncbi:DUF7619 domain-containing protein, partial [Rhizobium leguminosarum]|uniref:DUF7619 domain-containing protein n=1 Tax=Rhizobium leguminosarum TaxID=384 RepID=UPI003F963F82